MSRLNPKKILGYLVLQDCVIGYYQHRYEEGQKIIIEDEDTDNNWEGTEFYDSLPQIFEPITEESDDDLLDKANQKHTTQ